MGIRPFRRAVWLATALLVCGFCSSPALAEPSQQALQSGFYLLYGLDFANAHQVFAAWTQEHPEDPLGPVFDAAGLLFSEFNRLGVLESQFYADDKTFAARKQLSPDPDVRARFDAALALGESRARARLAKTPNDRDALFAMTLSSGLQGDYAALIEKRNLTYLRESRQAATWAAQLLSVDPNFSDAHVAIGTSKYIIGSMAAPVRWLLRLGGISGDKNAGIAELQVTAAHGKYLAPFARILLAIAYVRDKDNTRAREILVSLRDEFPNNPLFAHEIERLDSNR